jgi:A/G-specific adenine glycosylase
MEADKQKKDAPTIGKSAKSSGVLSPAEVVSFQEKIYSFYHLMGRRLPWRETSDPFRILVSEIMLQQTQVERVEKKYENFLLLFPDFEALAEAPLKDVLAAWQGLGYNRRALSLVRLARMVMAEHGGRLPATKESLVALPGIGKATAGAILAFAFGEATPFIETNIRRVFIHCFFEEEETVSDADILSLVEQTLDREDPRNWYYALMDYGSALKGEVKNPNRRSSRYRVQPPFQGSRRKLRGEVLRMLLVHSPMEGNLIAESLAVSEEDSRGILEELLEEGFVKEEDGLYGIS